MNALVEEYQQFVASRAKRMGSLGADLMHAAVGMVGEAVELRFSLSPNNVKVELGDFGFYAMHFQLALGWHGHDWIVPSETKEAPRLLLCADGLVDASGNLVDLVKKVWVYNKPLDAQQRSLIGLVLGDISQNYRGLCELVGYTEEEAISDNMAKLRERYPDGYSDAAAQARKDDANWGKA